MSLRSKTFSPDGTWTPTGNAALVGAAIKVAAAPTYNEDFEGYTPGQVPAGWVGVNGASVTVQTQGGQKCIDINTAFQAWGGAYYSSANFGDGCLVVQAVAASDRFVPVVRFNENAMAGYGSQMYTASTPGSTAFLSGVPTNMVSLNDFASNGLNRNVTANPALPHDLKIQTATLANGNIQLRTWRNGVVIGEFIDEWRKSPAGRIGAETYSGHGYYGYVKFFPTLTGGFSATFTPVSVTSWRTLAFDFQGEAGIRRKLSDLFDYRIDAGAWTPVPDNGDISAAPAGATISVRSNSTMISDYDASVDMLLNALSIQIDGVWDTAGSAPAAPTGLAAVGVAPDSIILTWTDGASDQLISVYRNTVNNLGTATLAACVVSGVQAFQDRGLATGTTYYYWLVAISAALVASPTAGPASAATLTGIPAGYILPTGKYNALASLEKWLQTNVLSAGAADLTWVFTAEPQPSTWSGVRVEVTEFIETNPGGGGDGNLIFPGAPGGQMQYGRNQQMRIQFDLYSQDAAGATTLDAKKRLYQVRDRIKHAFDVAGFCDANEALLLGPIQVLDYGNNPSSPAVTGVVLVPEVYGNGLLERYDAPTADQPGVHHYQLLVRFQWFEMAY